jgi:hypothetical protein
MYIVKPLNQLFKQILGILLLELSPLPDIAQQIATLAQLHDKAHMPIGLEAIIQPDDIGVIALLKNSHLLHDSLFLLLFISEHLLLNALDSDQVFADLVAGQVDFAESAPAEDPANSVEVASAALHVFVFLEVEADHFLQLFYVPVVLTELDVGGGFRAMVTHLVLELLVKLNHKVFTDVEGWLFDL